VATAIDYRIEFKNLTGNDPFPWQSSLFDCFTTGALPTSCDIPTGLGKTAVIPIWLIALATKPERVPRRLVYVVNRRTVVDQATKEAMDIRGRISGDLKTRLDSLCSMPSGPPLAISTLRGQFADNREWSADPAQPAIIVGTVDMIGSRLLFSGYRSGFKTRPLHAGFLGQDSLIVHDEAHLEPAFNDLLRAIETEQRLSPEWRSFRVLELSATSRGGDALRLTDTDRSNAVVNQRFRASKTIHLHPIEDEKKAPEAIVTLALKHRDAASTVLVFARTVKDVQSIAERLRREKQAVEVLTGTLRGKERDDLITRPTFHRFLPGSPSGSDTAYLICTSAGEVGINISADHLVCDLSTFDSMAQRFGRVNRFGLRSDTRIDIVHPLTFDEKKEPGEHRQRTVALLRKLRGDGSPLALGSLDLDERLAAFSPAPLIRPTSDVLFDAWALTTIHGKLPGRPPVADYLHGVSEWEPPRTTVAWREEVDVMLGVMLDLEKPEDLLEDYPLKPQELIKDSSDRVFEELVKLARRDPNQPAWLIDDQGTVEVLTVADLADKDKKDRTQNQTVLLGPKGGGLRNGFLDGASETADDVADDWFTDEDKTTRRRVRVWEGDENLADKVRGMRLVRRVRFPADDDDDDARPAWLWYERPLQADNDGSAFARHPVLLQVHTSDVRENLDRIVTALDLPPDMKAALPVAAKLHDQGKQRVKWQRGIGRPGHLTDWYAKSGRGWKGIDFNDGYRHELGSLMEAIRDPEFLALTEHQQDLVLHLIATHHGRGRPHFPAEEVFDYEREGEDVARVAAEVPRRFARLQRQYGRWGLAYLESLLRAADYAASASPSNYEEDPT
jgi:CRISPR-associated endonuclease/helicase Cas3